MAKNTEREYSEITTSRSALNASVCACLCVCVCLWEGLATCTGTRHCNVLLAPFPNLHLLRAAIAGVSSLCMDELDLDIRIAEQISSLWLDEPTSLLEAGTEFSGAQWVQGFGENRSSLVVLLFQLFFERCCQIAPRFRWEHGRIGF